MLYNVKTLISRLVLFHLLFGFLICCVMWKILIFRLMINQNAYIFKLRLCRFYIRCPLVNCHIWQLRRSSKSQMRNPQKAFIILLCWDGVQSELYQSQKIISWTLNILYPQVFRTTPLWMWDKSLPLFRTQLLLQCGLCYILSLCWARWLMHKLTHSNQIGLKKLTLLHEGVDERECSAVDHRHRRKFRRRRCRRHLHGSRSYG